MPHVPPHLVTPTYVELRTGGEYLYCAIHRTFHGSDDFTRDQSRLAARYCILVKCTPNEKANVDTLANMVPSAAGILEGRLRCGDSGAKATVQSDGERSKRAQKRGTDAGEEEAAAPRRAAKPKPRRSKRGKPLRTAKPRPKTAAARLRHQWTRRAGTVRVKWTVRRAGGAVDLPLCTTLAAQAATLERLRADGILREARPRKLHRTHGLVEYITDVTLLPEPGKFVCGQAAMMSGFGLELTELGIEVWAPSSRPCENLLSFAGMNRLCAAASGIGTALLLRKPLVRVTSQRQVLQRDHGVFIITGFHVPGAENDFEQLLSYSLEVMGLRVRVWWERADEFVWCSGVVRQFDATSDQHLVVYEDGEQHWHALHQEQEMGTLEFVDEPPYRSREHYDDTTHYVTYNADTRALFLYPNVTVLEDKDVAGVDAFCARLAQAPHYLHIPRDAELVRQVFVKVGEPGSTLRDLPHVCSTWLSKACGG